MLYSLSIFIYTAAIHLASRWNNKARAWVQGRTHWKSRVSAIRAEAGSRPIAWVHCASLGEFEQGRPVIEGIRDRYPHCFIVLSFFSPSGYEVRKNYNKADAVIYLPADTPANAAAFTNLLSPTLAIFVKYEYWLNLLDALEARKVPVLMISAIFRDNQVFFKWFGRPWRDALRTIDHFFLQDADSAARLSGLGIANCTITGDTRFDRVLDIASQFSPIAELEAFSKGAPVLVAGSTWKEDEELIRGYLDRNPALRVVIAPHEIDEAHLQQLGSIFTNSVRFSAWKADQSGEHGVLVIDNIGMLSRLYHYATVTYIGGGFGKGIHNTLEAAVHAKPVIFGPKYQKFREAVDLIEKGGAFSIDNADAFTGVMDKLLTDAAYRKNSGEAAGQYVQRSAGATGKIMLHIQEKRLLTN